MIVVNCGMPRSGSTLQYNIAWNLLEMTGRGERVLWEDFNSLRGGIDKLKECVASNKIYAVKSHSFSEEIRAFFLENQESVKFLYCYRDLRDVVYSLKRKFNYSYKKGLQRIDESIELENYLVINNFFLLSQPYEDLRYDLLGAVEGISSFLDLNVNKAIAIDIVKELNIDKAYERSSKVKVPFEHLRRKLAFLFGWKIKFADEKYMLHPGHVSENRGDSGQWRLDENIDQYRNVEERYINWFLSKKYTHTE